MHNPHRAQSAQAEAGVGNLKPHEIYISHLDLLASCQFISLLITYTLYYNNNNNNDNNNNNNNQFICIALSITDIVFPKALTRAHK